jgi:uncharacterized SAM-binding protein YcdF (DUF218 family)
MRPRKRTWVLALFLVATAVTAVVEVRLYHAIQEQATRDEAQVAGAIVVFGAAEYNGIPSPVLKARLDQALRLEERGLAPLVVTTGGSGGDLHYTEAGVGSDYLIQQGVAEQKILTEPSGETTLQSVRAVSQLLQQRGAKTCVAVSDGFHLYRVKLLFRAHGITAYGSPAANSPISEDPIQLTLHTLRETAICSLWYLRVRQ